jgi:L-lactate dehydrogenase complex protein LldG
VTARDDILSRVRRALDGVDPTAPPVPRGYRDSRPGGDLVALFAERVEDYRATVTRCTVAEVEAAIANALEGRSAVVPAGLPWTVPSSTVDEAHSAAELDTFEAVVTGASVGIATTGTIVLDHGPDQGRRAISLVPDLHVCVVAAAQIVADVPDAVARLDPLRPQTWISGPSATSDIELDRVEGVHGPRTLLVIVVEADQPPA